MKAAAVVVLVACGSTPSKQTVPVLPPDPTAEPAKPVPPPPERWAGTLVLPTDLRDIVVTFTSDTEATLAVPGHKLDNLPLTDVTHTADALTFTLAKPGAPPQANELYRFARTGDTAQGALRVMGQNFYAKLVKLKPGEAPHGTIARPQTPQPPYPYAEREVAITAPESGSLAGTLTVPEGKGPFPAVLLVSGSGQQDRDESIFGHKSFRLIADRLTREGFVVLRTDDRGVGKTTGALGSLDTDIADARAAFEFLAKQPEVDPKRTGILGHSVGGLIAPAIAVKTGKVAFIVALAGPGFPGAELVAQQIEAAMIASKLPEAAAKKIADVQRKVGKAVVKGDEKEIRAALRESLVVAADALGQPKPDDATLDKLADSKMADVKNAWVVSFFKAEPQWRKVKCPVLAVIGDKDLQVPADANLGEIGKALKAAGNKDVTLEKRPGLNHLYQHAMTGLVDEYGVIEETFDPATLDLIADWLKRKTKAK